MATSTDERVVGELLQQFTGFTNKPESFLGVQAALSTKLKKSTKSLYDFVKTVDSTSHLTDALPELIIENFDEEQIWQELELQNKPCVDNIVEKMARILTRKDEESPFGLDGDEEFDAGESVEGSVGELDNEMESGGSEGSDEEGDLEELKQRLGLSKDRTLDDINDDSDDPDFADFKEFEVEEEEGESSGDDDGDGAPSKNSRSKLKKRKTEVDDKFFKMADMEAFLEMEDAKFEREGKKKDDEESDEEMDLDEEDENEDVMYSAFFDEPEDNEDDQKPKKVKFAKSGENSDEQDEESREARKANLFESDGSEGEDVHDIVGGKKEEKSTYEMRQERLKKKITEMEEANLGEKPWQLAGEASATARPENSLLEEVLDFEHTTKLPPVVTEETTKSLEDLIKQRIKDKAFDDVERKVKPTENPIEYKKRIVLDQEKSKKSLGEIYEQEYLKEQQDESGEEENDAQHEEIKNMMQSLFVKLDALSNFHYTPKPAAPEVRIVSNLPSIAMEEVAPVAVSKAALLAPEEIKEKTKGEVKGQGEKTDTDRKRERREKKAAKRARRQQKESKEKLVEKMNPGLGNKYSKQKAMDMLEKESKSSKNLSVIKDNDKSKTSLSSSKSFFTQLQDEVSSQIKNKKAQASQKKEKERNSQKFKL